MASRLTTLIVVFIVAATFVAGIITRAQRDDQGPVDLIVFNGKVYAGDGKTFAEAVAVRGNKIVVVGSNREVKRLRRPQTTIIDAHGGAVVPGFNDSHVHFMDGSAAVSEINLTGVGSLEQLTERLRSHAIEHNDRIWITGHGWNERSLDRAVLTREQLDSIVPDRPVSLTSVDGGLAWVNSAALALAGIDRTTRNPRAGVIEHNQTGEPSGVLRGSAIDLMKAAVPAPTHEEQLEALQAGIDEAHRLGITSVQNASGTQEQLALWDELRDAHALTLRTYQSLVVSPNATGSDIDKLDETRKEFGDDPLLKTGSVEIVADNIQIEDRARPRRSRLSPGRFTAEQLKRLVTLFDLRGWQVWIHTNSEQGVDAALDAFQAAAEANPAPARGRRHRIEHAPAIDRDAAERFAKLGVIASLQPVRATETDTDRTALEPWNSLVDAGARLAFGSDWPAVRLDPRIGLRDVVAAPAPEPEIAAAAPAGTAGTMSLPSAIDAYTSGAAYASFDEQRKGTLAPGMLADIVILSADIFATPADRMLDVRVDVTIFDGQVVYEKNAD